MAGGALEVAIGGEGLGGAGGADDDVFAVLQGREFDAGAGAVEGGESQVDGVADADGVGGEGGGEAGGFIGEEGRGGRWRCRAA